jgi:hypothetical protein
MEDELKYQQMDGTQIQFSLFCCAWGDHIYLGGGGGVAGRGVPSAMVATRCNTNRSCASINTAHPASSRRGSSTPETES